MPRMSDWNAWLDLGAAPLAGLKSISPLSFLRDDDGLSIQVRPFQSPSLPTPVANDLRFNVSFRGFEATPSAPLSQPRPASTWAREVDDGGAQPLFVGGSVFEAAIVADRFDFAQLAETAIQGAAVAEPVANAAVRAAVAEPAAEVVIASALVAQGTAFSAGDATRWVSAFDYGGDGVADRGLCVMSVAVLDATDYVT